MNYKKLIPDALCILLFAIIAAAYFYPADLEGRRLTGHDNSAADGLSAEIENYRARHDGETPRWINSIFCGMPTYQVAPSYDSTRTMSTLEKAYHLWLPDYVWYIFASMLGFYILLRAFDFRQWMAALGAIVWAFSSYFFIIIAAGHIWKVITLCYVPPTIAGMVLLYRGKYLWGGLLTAFFAALQIAGNHVQMTYYFLLPELCLFLAFLVQAVRDHALPRFWKATGVLALAAVVAVALNASNLYHTYEYAKDTMRGKSELVKEGTDRQNQTDSGLDRDYITAWSYGLYETWSLLIPNINGGASVPLSQSKRAMQQADPVLAQNRIYDAFTQYWGEQPMTSGPVYVGALVCLLFLLALIVLPRRSPLKWALLAATILSILLSWGKNFMGFTNLFIDHVPMYAKFRTVSSILVVAEFTIPLLALLGLREFIQQCRQTEHRPAMLRALTVSTLATAFVCLCFALAPTALGDCVSTNDRQAMQQYVAQGYFDQMVADTILASLSAMRASLLTADAWRSLFIILLGAVALYWFWNTSRKYVPTGRPTDSPASEGELKGATLLSVALLLICLADMWSVNKRYLNDPMFTTVSRNKTAEKTPADEYILGKSGTGRDYRVLNYTVNTFNDNSTSYFYSSIGGYHAAKLRRYQELIEAHIVPEMNRLYEALADTAATDIDQLHPVLDMLNTKWFILPGQQGMQIPLENPVAMGNAWFVNDVRAVATANEEMEALSNVDPRSTAVVNTTQFALPKYEHDAAESSIRQTSLTSTSVTYETDNDRNALAVFSEIYYPGWRATIDGQPADILRADYVLRALPVPKGKHVIKMTFDPQSVHTTETIAYVALALLLLTFLAAILLQGRKLWQKQ